MSLIDQRWSHCPVGPTPSTDPGDRASRSRGAPSHPARTLRKTGLYWLFAGFCASPLAGCEGKVPPPGDTAPEIRATDLEGRAITPEELRGRVVLVNVWATWCEPCRDELPELQRLHQTYADRGLTVIGFATDAASHNNRVRLAARNNGLGYSVVHETSGEIMRAFKVDGLPTSVLIDRAGSTRWRRVGAIRPNDSELVRVIEATLAEPP